MKIDPNARYTQSHEWVRQDGDLLIYGITDHAQNALSDIVFVELPEIGEHFAAGETLGTVESVKAASDLYMPLDGEITAVNEALISSPEVINSDPYGQGWMVKFKPADMAGWDGLLTAEAYQQLEGE
jgi:glycine cleavage system H protein